MNKDEQDNKKFLEQQLQWCKNQGRILEEIEMKLYKMKEIAQYALDHDLNLIEIEKLNGQLTELTNEVHFLEN